MRVDVDFNGRVHADDAKSPDNFWGIRNLLGSEEELVMVLLPAIIEALETAWGETDRSCRCEV